MAMMSVLLMYGMAAFVVGVVGACLLATLVAGIVNLVAFGKMRKAGISLTPPIAAPHLPLVTGLLGVMAGVGLAAAFLIFGGMLESGGVFNILTVLFLCVGPLGISVGVLSIVGAVRARKAPAVALAARVPRVLMVIFGILTTLLAGAMCLVNLFALWVWFGQ